LTEDKEVTVVRSSGFYSTSPVDLLEQPEFLNNVVEIRTELSATQLLEKTRTVEQRISTLKKIPKGPRVIDIDILTYHLQTNASEQLQLPHPSICQRRFVLVPLLEVDPDAYCIRDRRPYRECLQAITDRSQLVEPYHG
jgi:2-amino-4-hydroxy-6-hydroxymethyldihydropteridine diphosphokinase